MVAPLNDMPAPRSRVQQADPRAEIVVVAFHGGAEGSDKTHVPQGTESFLGENRGDLRRFTHAVIDAGADLVVGSGPHVMRGMEMYKDRLIAYSMGNFAGYSVFSLGGVLSTRGVLQVTLNPDGTWVKGKMLSTKLVDPGYADTDACGRCDQCRCATCRGPTSASPLARIGDDGTILPPGASLLGTERAATQVARPPAEKTLGL